MHIIDMRLYLDIELSGLDEVSDAGRFIVTFETAEEYENNREWFEGRLAHPSSRIKEAIPAESVNWRLGPFIIMLYNGAIEYAEYVDAQRETAFVPLKRERPGLQDRALAHYRAWGQGVASASTAG